MAPRTRGKGKAKGKTTYKRKAPMRRSSNVTVIRENYHKETLKGYVDEPEAASANVKVQMACGPQGISGAANFPGWAALAAKYEEYRVTYASLTTILGSEDKPAFSLIERDAVAIESTDAMNKNPQRQLHILDANNKKVLRAWKPSTSSDYDFQSTDLANSVAKAHIKLLQAGLTNEVQKFQSSLCIVCEFRGLKNN